MTKVELQKELNKAERKLNDYKSKKRKAKDERIELEELIQKLYSHKKKIEDHMDSILHTISNRISNLNPHSKLRDSYNYEAKRIIKGNNTSKALDKVTSAIRKSKNKVLSIDDDIDYYNNKISYYQKKVYELRNQINSL